VSRKINLIGRMELVFLVRWIFLLGVAEAAGTFRLPVVSIARDVERSRTREKGGKGAWEISPLGPSDNAEAAQREIFEVRTGRRWWTTKGSPGQQVENDGTLQELTRDPEDGQKILGNEYPTWVRASLISESEMAR
jgi:hypothetical protein